MCTIPQEMERESSFRSLRVTRATSLFARKISGRSEQVNEPPRNWGVNQDAFAALIGFPLVSLFDARWWWFRSSSLFSRFARRGERLRAFRRLSTGCIIDHSVYIIYNMYTSSAALWQYFDWDFRLRISLGAETSRSVIKFFDWLPSSDKSRYTAPLSLRENV